MLLKMLIARTFTFSFFILLISHYGFSCSLYAEPLEIIHVRPAEVIPINGLWNFKTQTLGEVRKIYTGKPLVEQGISFPVHGEYEVKVFYDDSEIAKAQGIFLDRIHEADRTYFNGILIGKTGKFLPEGDYSPNWYVRRLYQIPEHLIKKNSYNTVRVEFFSANSGFEGGIFRGVPLIGDYSILRERLLDEDIVIIAIASLFMGILVYQGLIFILRNKSYPSLFLALTCLAFILWRVPLINKVNSSGINFQFLMRIFFVSQTLFPLGLAFFCHSLYKTGFQKMELVSIFAISVIAALHIFPVPIELRLNLIIVWEGLVLFLAFFVIKITLKEAGKKKKEAMFVGTGFVLLVILSATDIIIDNTTGKNIFLTQYGFLSVVFMAAVSISYQNAVIHKEIERLNVSLEKIVEDRTQELSSKNKIFENDLLIAAGLQSRLIPRGKPKIADLSLESVYLPMDKIGGDYFDWAVLSESKIGFIICDVLGHGISAAFISSMLKVSFMDLSKKTENPSELLSKMNSQL
ncbi:MAG: SpoIIE family protein phosphatase, partial [Leptospira sp.]|nr:SpoIIE family protein phosphatase [Leptospira sp.]